MTKKISQILVLCLILFAFEIISCSSGNKKNVLSNIDTSSVSVEPLSEPINNDTIINFDGAIGLNVQFNSGFLDLKNNFDFLQGDSLVVNVGGTAQKVLIRLLASNNDANSPTGIIGTGFIVNANRLVCIRLDQDYPAIKQISAHGGPNPWGIYPLGSQNGAATIQKVKLIRKR
ncbi:MAG TPA: hypothetical protein PKN48_08390 [Bacteroidales bacterium]|nr:hypothetical protein [Bacteroidales bacterium]